MKLLELKDRESSDTDIGEIRICVEGYDNSLRGDELKSALTRHFSSCGVITRICIPKDVGSDTLNISFIHIRGEDAEKKALELNGSDMGGWNIVVEPFPLRPEFIPELGAKAKSSTSYIKGDGWIDVTGYDTSLPEDDIKSALIKHFSSCGEITEASLLKRYKKARVYIKGEGAVEKAVKLSGCECDVKGCKFVAKKYIWPKRRRLRTGYTVQECDVKGCKFVAEKHIPQKRLRGQQSTGYTIPDWYIQEAKRAKMAKV